MSLNKILLDLFKLGKDCGTVSKYILSQDQRGDLAGIKWFLISRGASFWWLL